MRLFVVLLLVLASVTGVVYACYEHPPEPVTPPVVDLNDSVVVNESVASGNFESPEMADNLNRTVEMQCTK